jgi:hypothetical protein
MQQLLHGWGRFARLAARSVVAGATRIRAGLLSPQAPFREGAMHLAQFGRVRAQVVFAVQRRRERLIREME